MVEFAFEMEIAAGAADEYRRRHDEIWPELVERLREAGIARYSIYLAEDGRRLFATMECLDRAKVDALARTEVMQRWWRMMADIMTTNPDCSPRAVDMPLMFRL